MTNAAEKLKNTIDPTVNAVDRMAAIFGSHLNPVTDAMLAEREEVSYDFFDVCNGVERGVDGVPADASSPFNGFSLPGRTTDTVRAEYDPGYVFRREPLQVLQLAYRTRKPLNIWGPTGTGKTSFLAQLFLRVGIDFELVSANPDDRPSDTLQVVQPDASTAGLKVLDRALVRAAENGYPVILDEWDTWDPRVMTYLHRVFDGNAFTLPYENRTIVPAQGFFIAMTANSNGTFDKSGHYGTSNNFSWATRRRIMSYRMGYGSEDHEVKVVLDYLRAEFGSADIDNPKADYETKLVRPFVEIAARLRSLAQTDGLPEPSTAFLKEWARDALLTGDEALCFDLLYVNALDSEAQATTARGVLHAVRGGKP